MGGRGSLWQRGLTAGAAGLTAVPAPERVAAAARQCAAGAGSEAEAAGLAVQVGRHDRSVATGRVEHVTNMGSDQVAQIQREQITAYERRGPILGRLTQFATMIAILAAVVVSTLVFDTLSSLYPGTGVVKSTPAERPAEATVQGCERVGPVGGDGLGYWWRCAVTVRIHDGREVETVVGHSVVTPADIGKSIEFREVCYGQGNTDCRYGRPASRVWALAVSVLGMIRIAVVLVLISGAGFYLIRGVVGVPRYFAWLNRRDKRGSA